TPPGDREPVCATGTRRLGSRAPSPEEAVPAPHRDPALRAAEVHKPSGRMDRPGSTETIHSSGAKGAPGRDGGVPARSCVRPSDLGIETGVSGFGVFGPLLAGQAPPGEVFE